MSIPFCAYPSSSLCVANAGDNLLKLHTTAQKQWLEITNISEIFEWNEDYSEHFSDRQQEESSICPFKAVNIFSIISSKPFILQTFAEDSHYPNSESPALNQAPFEWNSKQPTQFYSDWFKQRQIDVATCLCSARNCVCFLFDSYNNLTDQLYEANSTKQSLFTFLFT